MATIKLGRMVPDYGMPCASDSKPDKDQPQVERFPTAYIDLDSLPDLVPGQEVTLKGVVTSFSDRKVRSKEDGKEEIEVDRHCEVDILEMMPGDKKAPANPPQPSDEEAVDKGLDEAMPDDEEGD